MSLKYRNSQGVETPVAGLNGQNGSLVPSVALYQQGRITIQATQNAVSTANVVLSTPMPDVDYIVNLELNSAPAIPSIGSIGIHAVSSPSRKSVNGFEIAIYNDTDTDASVIVQWTAFKLMTDTVHEADAAHIAQNTANFAPAFSEVTSYAVGDYVTYNNVLYRCTTAHTAGVWVAGHFTQVTVGGDLSAIVPSNASASNKLLSYKSTQLYANYQSDKTKVVRIEYPSNLATRLHLITEPGAALRDVFIQLTTRNPFVTVYDMGVSSLFTIKTAAVSNKRVVYINVGTSDGSVIINQDDVPTDGYGTLLLPTVTVTNTSDEEWTSATAITPKKLVTESDLAIKKMDISATGGATSFSATIPLSMAQRNKPFYLEVLSVGNDNAIKEMKYLVFVSSINTIVTTKEISKDDNFTKISITFNESTGYELSFSSTDTLYSTTVYIQQ